jgi:hypothetical protein
MNDGVTHMIRGMEGNHHLFSPAGNIQNSNFACTYMC